MRRSKSNAATSSRGSSTPTAGRAASRFEAWSSSSLRSAALNPDPAKVESAKRTVYGNAYADGLQAGRDGKRLSLVGVTPHLFKLAFARGWAQGSTEYAAGLLKAQGEGQHAAFIRATSRYLHSQESLKRLGVEWPVDG